jgi:lipopolysaccharide/colanic/teichoic acid biosynthesis glycosyltransferase
VKRLIDLVVSGAALVMTSPILLAAAIAVKVETPGPAFYSGRRVGKDGRTFRIFKLRTMLPGADQLGPAVTAGDDSRITTVGSILRRTKIDELPQLLNVLKGEMSLVGPRPEHPEFVARYTPDQRRVLTIRPGMTGPAALAFVDEEELLRGADPEAAYLANVLPHKLAVDLEYVESASVPGDFRILGRTLLVVARRVLGSRRRV